MFKNFIISILLIYNLSSKPGWAVTGLSKFLLASLLVILFTILFSELDMIVKETITEIKGGKDNA